MSFLHAKDVLLYQPRKDLFMVYIALLFFTLYICISCYFMHDSVD
jgi:quinol-cytochrome oxidoreductase complex cytochrome b subunit